MTDYRIYLMEGPGRHGRSFNVNCGTDDDARAMARNLLHPNPPMAEIWAGSRCVGMVHAPATVTDTPADRPPVYRSGAVAAAVPPPGRATPMPPGR
jgi:hypothetical protein